MRRANRRRIETMAAKRTKKKAGQPPRALGVRGTKPTSLAEALAGTPEPSSARAFADRVLGQVRREIEGCVTIYEHADEVVKGTALSVDYVRELAMRQIADLGQIRDDQYFALFEKLDRGEDVHELDVLAGLADLPAVNYRRLLAVWKPKRGRKTKSSGERGKWIELAALAREWRGDTRNKEALRAVWKAFRKKK